MITGVAVLGGAAALLLCALAGKARRPDTSIPGPVEHRRRWRRLHGDLDPDANRWVSAWLAVLYRVARQPARLGLSPNLLTLCGVWCAAAALTATYGGGRWPLLAAVAVLGSGVADGLDGAVAALTGRATAFGAVLDAVADRAADVLLALVLFALGAPAWLVAAAPGVTGGLEYIRARGTTVAGGAGGRITPGERPTRLLLVLLGAVAAGIAPDHAGAAATVAAAATFGLVTLSCCWLLVDLRARLGPGR